MAEESGTDLEQSAKFQEAFREALRVNHQKMFDSVLERALQVHGQQNLEHLAGGWDKPHQAGVVKAVIDEETRTVTNPHFESGWPKGSPVPQSMKRIYNHVNGAWNLSTREHFLSDVLHEELQSYQSKPKEETTGLIAEEDPVMIAEKAEGAITNAFQSGKLKRPSDITHFTLYQAQWDFEKEEDIYNRIKEEVKTTKV